MDKWFYQHRSRELGPLSADELQYLASIAKIDADTNVRKEGTIDWIKYQQTEIFVKPISQTIRVIKPAPDSAKTMHVDSLQEIGTANVATQTDIIARLPQPAISILTEEQRRARIVSAGHSVVLCPRRNRPQCLRSACARIEADHSHGRCWSAQNRSLCPGGPGGGGLHRTQPRQF